LKIHTNTVGSVCVELEERAVTFTRVVSRPQWSARVVVEGCVTEVRYVSTRLDLYVKCD